MFFSGSRGTSQHPSNKSPPLMTPSSHSGLDTFTGAIGGSEYAVTYRRGTGVVSGNAGNQGTSRAPDLQGVKSTNHEIVQSRSPGDSAKMSRRAAMHITGPTLVTVPLHITTNLGALQRGDGDRIIHYGGDKDGKEKIIDKEKADEVEIKDNEGEKNDKEISMERTEDNVACGGIEIERDGMKEKQHEDCGHKPEMVMADVFREIRPKILSSDFEEANVITDEMDHDENSEYMGNCNYFNIANLLPPDIFINPSIYLSMHHPSTHPPTICVICANMYMSISQCYTVSYIAHISSIIWEISSIFSLDSANFCFLHVTCLVNYTSIFSIYSYEIITFFTSVYST